MRNILQPTSYLTNMTYTTEKKNFALKYIEKAFTEEGKRHILFYGSLLEFIDSKVHLSTSMPCMRACAWQNQYQSVWMNQQNDIYDPKFWETAEETCGIIEFFHVDEIFRYHTNGLTPYDVMKQYVNTVLLKDKQDTLFTSFLNCCENSILDNGHEIIEEEIKYDGIGYSVMGPIDEMEVWFYDEYEDDAMIIGLWDGEQIVFSSDEEKKKHEERVEIVKQGLPLFDKEKVEQLRKEIEEEWGIRKKDKEEEKEESDDCEESDDWMITYEGVQYCIDRDNNSVLDDELFEIGRWDGENITFTNQQHSREHQIRRLQSATN